MRCHDCQKRMWPWQRTVGLYFRSKGGRRSANWIVHWKCAPEEDK